MNRNRQWLAILSALLMSAASYAGESKAVPLSAVMAGNAEPTAPHEPGEPAVTIPTHYVAKQMEGGIPAVLIGTALDIATVEASKNFDGLKEGVFLIRASTSRAYYPDTGKFGGETPDAKSEMRKAGLKHVKMKRHDTGKIPVLEVQFEEGGRMNYIGYIAIDQTVLTVNFATPTPSSEVDEERWDSFINGVSPQNLK